MELKLRAWQRSAKVMYQVFCIDLMTYMRGYHNKLYINEDLSEWAYVQHCELMQYVGEKARNGKEIFQGDIVNRFLSFKNKYELYEIGYFKVDCIGRRFESIKIVKESMGLSDLLMEDEFEIIGNIYENPELVEEGE